MRQHLSARFVFCLSSLLTGLTIGFTLLGRMLAHHFLGVLSPAMNASAAQGDPYDELHRRITKTSRIRFLAARRLGAHARFSQWTIALLSVVLIIIPLMQALGALTRFGPQLLNVIQVALAVLVLVFSLLIGMDNFAVRAERMHACGLDLADLGREIEFRKDSHTSTAAEDYHRDRERYYAILRAHENHANLDYYRTKLDEPLWYYPGKWKYRWGLFSTAAWYLFAFSPYVLIFLVFFGTIWLMLA